MKTATSPRSLLPPRSSKSLDLGTRTAPRLVAIPIGDNGEHEINVVYRPAAITPATLAQLRQLAKAGKQTESGDGDSADTADKAEGMLAVTEQMIGMVLGSVVEWDLTRDGETVPLTAEGLQNVDIDILSLIVGGMQEAQKPTPTKPAPSTTG